MVRNGGHSLSTLAGSCTPSASATALSGNVLYDGRHTHLRHQPSIGLLVSAESALYTQLAMSFCHSAASTLTETWGGDVRGAELLCNGLAFAGRAQSPARPD